MKRELDSHDKKLLSILAEDGLSAAGEVASRMGVTGPTVRSRMKSLLRDGVLRVAGLVNPSRTKGITLALVGLTLQSHTQLDKKLEQVSKLEKVNWAAAVTGRYDLMVEVVLTRDMDDLYRFIHEELSKIGGIAASETFVIMKAKRKWILLPSGIRRELTQHM